MASLETVSATAEISPHFDKLLKEVSSELSPEELKHAVSSIKSVFKGKFEDQQERDLYSCLHLFANQGVVSEDNLTLLERFVTPKTSKKESIQEKIQGFKTIRQQEAVKTKEDLTGRVHDLEKVMTRLTTGSSSVVNLYGSSGVGKTTLAIETLSKWPGRKFKADFRGVTEIKGVHFHVLNALTGSEQTVVSYEANPVIGQMQQLMRDGQSDILLLLDNVDHFAGGEGDAAKDQNINFVTFLRRLQRLQGKSKLKILLTSRIELRHGDSLDVDNYEVKALDKSVSSALLQTHGNLSFEDEQRDKLVKMCQGNPLILNGMAAILRQNIADDKKLLETIEQEAVTGIPETGLPPTEKVTQEREIFNYKEEGIDKEQENCLRKMFFFLPSKRLKESAVSMSLFCRSFSAEAAATILGVDSSEAVIQLEGLRNSKVVAVDPEAKVLSYDIHPLMRKFLRSIGNSNIFIKVYQKARDRFCNLFMSKVKEVSGLLDQDYIEAFNRFDLDKPNFELALNISLKSDQLLIPEEHHDSVMICYLFEAMLDQKQQRSIFNSWAEKAEEDGKEGSLLRAELKSREALQVLHLEGWQKALEVLKMADESLKTIQKETKNSKSFRLTRSSYLYVQGEVYYRAGNMAKSLRILHRSLKIMEDLLQSHTSTSRCLNAIGNCHNKLGEHDEAIKFYTRAYEMRKELSGSMNHFDMPFFKGQIGTVYEGKREFHKAIEWYKEALELSKELKIPGMINTALYNRNIANSYAWLRDFDEAYQPAKDAYEIRKDILGNHPWTARSAFQMAEICRSLEDFKEAEEYYAEAWDIEKSLGQGNHSEIMVRLVQTYEAMLRGVRKEAFQKEWFEFYLRYWDEERKFEGFEFSLVNKKVIDSINERLSDLSDRQTEKKYQREALWFYDGAWNSPDTKKLPRQQREDILQDLLRLCKMLREKDLVKKYEAEAFRFYEKLWKKNKETMERQDRIDILTTLENYASSFKDENKAQKYGSLLKQVKQSGSVMGSLRSLLSFGSAAEQQSSDDDDDSDDEDNNVYGVDSDNDDDDGSNGSEDITEQVQQLAMEEQELEEPDNADEQDPDKIKIHEGTVTSEGVHWDLKEGAVHMTFPRDAVSEPTLIMVHKWKSRACSPQLQEHEAVVSNVIEISTGSDEALEFNADVKLVLSHSAPNLHGYELVVFKLADKEENEWQEVDGIENFRSLSDIEDEYPSAKDAPDFYFPVVQVEISECSTYAVVCRLKSSPPYIITANGGLFTLPEYPSVSVDIPKKAVAPKTKIDLQIKVQEVPGEEFEGKDVQVGPILRIFCTEVVEFLKPVTIQLPVSLEDEKQDIPDLSSCRVRVLFLKSDVEQKEWVEITDDLTNPPSIDGNIVRFQVQRFSGYVCNVKRFRMNL
ncbi:uncharacterized protein LOC144665649 isoform X2 [Oculina patagonica]